jgi:hypothetical protein
MLIRSFNVLGQLVVINVGTLPGTSPEPVVERLLGFFGSLNEGSPIKPGIAASLVGSLRSHQCHIFWTLPL